MNRVAEIGAVYKQTQHFNRSQSRVPDVECSQNNKTVIWTKMCSGYGVRLRLLLFRNWLYVELYTGKATSQRTDQITFVFWKASVHP